MLTLWLLLSLAFGFGYIVRGLLSLRDVAELDEIRSKLDAEVALLKRMSEL